MFDSTMELITTLASSNNFLIFCICNFIIIFLLINGLNPESTTSHQESVVFVPSIINRQIIEKKVQEKRGNQATLLFDNDIEEASSMDDKKSLDVNKQVLDDHNDDGKDDNNYIVKGDDVNDDEEYDDELRRRAEEFIEKINRRWKAEKLATLRISVI
ncbi:Protein of unknown function DUF761 [Macleaya cordata]|uniref:Uncharacterized protein n=1 Tax=Macleaya cordata TaxID=56857 RepID=A0A200QBF1_MACCD|nr:Protein of unknown function DUF761 [Macleaya cordata]